MAPPPGPAPKPLHLILQLPAGNSAAPCTWRLLDRNGNLLREGAGAPADAPRGDRLTVTIPANRVLYTELKLPPVSAARMQTLLPFAIEDKLMSDPATILALAGPAAGEGARAGFRVVAVVDKPWLVETLRSLQAVGLSLDAVIPQSELVPREAGTWSALLPPGEREGVLVRDDGFAWAFDISADPTPPLAVVLAVKEAAAHAPKQILAFAENQESIAGWHAALGLPVQWRTPTLNANTASPFDFLTHPALRSFASRPGWQAALPMLKPAAIVASLILLVHFASLGVNVWRLDRQQTELRRDMVATFQTAFPEAKAIVDPALQMSRNLAALRRERGEATDPVVPALAAMNDAARKAGAKVNRIQFDGRKVMAEISLAGNTLQAGEGLVWTPGADGKSGTLSKALEP